MKGTKLGHILEVCQYLKDKTKNPLLQLCNGQESYLPKEIWHAVC